MEGIFSPYSLCKSPSCPLAVCVCIFFSSNFVEYIVPFVFVFSSVFLLCLSHTQLYISLSPWLWLFFSYPLFLLMSSFVCIFLSVFLPLSSFPSVPLVFTSCSAVEGSRGGKGMLILSPQRRSGWERDRKRDGEKMALVWGNEMAIAPCVCMSVCMCVCIFTEKIRVTVWMTFLYFFPPASPFSPAKWCIGLSCCVQVVCTIAHMCAFAFDFFFSIYRNCCFLPYLYVSQVNHLPLTLFFTPLLSCFTPSLKSEM